ncbi:MULTISPECIES: exonuclease SbcCD subunit D [Lacticaseibacillus]|uniref:Nuclease SbcCD subunit D n=1 Tax=Lacticaseibacillus casei DSM 20011 = JCM 1134 = ATCC 393 TaxID=1423732 RepID=A0AAD1ERX0_LACCA|nr:exonuclease SbcCD subunit D [Lacticaseibacillus casei]MBI6597927.1 exonuclease SbcCD subunit D [Lacticaseibacillus casei]MBO1481604.1 exonuclease SbcCD subunit D [Lacticaseibacillus casei]MBO2416882.1 exonuclease SbcCD subunit D [Lacticaseibacillus casei]MCK2080312.1 exonuclease SbcCD subunit D [Lacticaseibacillus casei]MDZ5496020.1 exonuclease SbcCD subunit D [Lacticaseibacillus casei]
MRFLHTADWHIGKKLNDFDLLADQQAVFEQLVAVAQAQQVDAIVIAGDLYDRALPSEAAVAVLDQMLVKLNRDLHYPLLVISGNHDSAVRLRTGRSWFSATQMFVNTQLAEAFTPIELDGVQFFLLPYFEPFAVRDYFHDQTITNVAQAIRPIVTKMKTLFKPNMRHILVSHFFAAGSDHSASETKVNVGGLDAVPIDDLAAFDYVALGHLHNHNALHGEPKIQYSGALLKYADGEAKQEKGVYIVDTETMQREFVPLKPQHDLLELKASYADLTDPVYYQKQDRDAYIGVDLTDTQVIPNVMAQLRQIYPRIISLRRENGVQAVKPLQQRQRDLDPVSLLKAFYEELMQTELTADQLKWAKAGLAAAESEQKQ